MGCFGRYMRVANFSVDRNTNIIYIYIYIKINIFLDVILII